MRVSQANPALSLRDIVTIAKRHGLEPRDTVVASNAEQAIRYHGTAGTGPNTIDGRFNAQLLLDSYLYQEARDQRIEACRHSDFSRDAYGDRS